MATKQSLNGSAGIMAAERAARPRAVPHKRRRAAASIQNAQRAVSFKIPVLEAFLLRVNREIGLVTGSYFIRFVNDSEMARLNGAFRKKPRTTDVLSFPHENRSRPTNLKRRVRSLRGSFLGDIAISPRVARRNARAFGRTFTEEVCILMLHGILHLLGYDHENDRGEMERVETRLRRRVGLG
jgi:rRNA maturation RNase YbeY